MANLYSLPQSLKKSLKKGEYAVYQLSDVYYTSDGKFVGRTVGIPNKDTVSDSDGNIVPIAYVTGYDSDGNPTLGKVWFTVETECTVLCMSGVKHQSLYNFLEISNYNESNPNRDPNITPLFRRIDSMSNAKQTRSQRSDRVTALKAVISMSNDEVEKFIRTNQVVGVRIVQKPTGELDYEAMRDSLERWAEQNPGIVLRLTEGTKSSSDAEIEKLISNGKASGLIGFDMDTKSWYGASGKAFLKVNSAKDGAQVAELISYLKSAQGLKIYEKLKEANK